VYLVIFVLISQSSLSSLIPFEMPRRSCIFLSYYITVLVPLRYIRNAHALESLDIPPFHCIHPNIAAITTISQRITPSWAFRRVLFSYPFVTFCYPSDPIYTGQPPLPSLPKQTNLNTLQKLILFDCPPTNLPPIPVCSLLVPIIPLLSGLWFATAAWRRIVFICSIIMRIRQSVVTHHVFLSF